MRLEVMGGSVARTERGEDNRIGGAFRRKGSRRQAIGARSYSCSVNGGWLRIFRRMFGGEWRHPWREQRMRDDFLVSWSWR